MKAPEFQRIPKEQLRDIPSMLETIMERMLQAKERLYEVVIRQAIKREPVLDDFKEVNITVHDSYPNQELIAYKGTVLGRIILSMDYDIITNNLTWTFEPIPTFKQNGTI